MPTRRLPRTDDERSNALSTCLDKSNSITDPAKRLITPDQFTLLGSTASAWAAARNSQGPLLAAQSASTKTANAAADKLRRLISHYIQVMNLAIDRGEIAASDRALYQLDVSSASVPALTAVADLKLWAGRIADGESKRVAAGGPPMAMPGAAQVADALTAFNEADSAQSNAKTAFDAGQETVNALRPGADTLIKDLWDTIEFTLRNDDAPSLRRKAREWGVAYDGDETPVEDPAPAPTPAPNP
jgi:hypothetical protein